VRELAITAILLTHKFKTIVLHPAWRSSDFLVSIIKPISFSELHEIRGGLNGSMQHSAHTHIHLKTKAKSAGED